MTTTFPVAIIFIVDILFLIFASIMIIMNNFDSTKHTDNASRSIYDINNSIPVYMKYNIENYNQSIKRTFNKKENHIIGLTGSSMIMGTIFSGNMTLGGLLSYILSYMKFVWFVGFPHILLQNIGYLYFKEVDFLLDETKIVSNIGRLKGKHIIFVLPTKGGNFDTVRVSVESVIFWSDVIRMRYGPIVSVHQWVICEEDDYKRNKEKYLKLGNTGARVIVVPHDFKTANGTKYKARALVYAHKVLIQEGLVNKDVWIYHQDDESKVGEDTFLGIMDYIINASDKDVFAAGIIVYADSLSYTPSKAQEPARSYDDFRILFTTKTGGKLSFGHHGSHLLVRSDVEVEIGWDFGDVRTEDWMFGLMMWQRHRPANTVLKGFCYEKPPLSVMGLLKQRRRWAFGAMQIIRDRRVKLGFRLTALYGVISWLSALPSLLVFVLNVLYPTGGLFFGSGFVAGFTWYSLYSYFTRGYLINEIYITAPANHGTHFVRLRKIFAVIGGMMLESLAPWYALIRPPNGFEVIKKDDG